MVYDPFPAWDQGGGVWDPLRETPFRDTIAACCLGVDPLSNAILGLTQQQWASDIVWHYFYIYDQCLGSRGITGSDFIGTDLSPWPVHVLGD